MGNCESEPFANSKVNSGISMKDASAVKNATDDWILEVVVHQNPKNISNMFCKDGILWGTVSRIIRDTKPSIKEYFEYFANKKGIKVLNQEYNIKKVSNDVYINNAYVTWTWDGISKPITARMTFIFKKELGNMCISQLHSSALPKRNENVR